MADGARQMSEKANVNEGFLPSQMFAWSLALGAASLFQWQPAIGGLKASLVAISEERRNRAPLFQPDAYKLLRELQSRIPAGERILVMVDTPYMLDFSRNKIFNVESVGLCSPFGGLPFFKGPEELKRYLVKNNINYVLFVHSESALMYYRRDYWKNNPWVKQGYNFISDYGRFVVDLSENLEFLADWSSHSIKTPTHTILRLAD